MGWLQGRGLSWWFAPDSDQTARDDEARPVEDAARLPTFARDRIASRLHDQLPCAGRSLPHSWRCPQGSHAELVVHVLDTSWIDVGWRSPEATTGPVNNTHNTC